MGRRELNRILGATLPDLNEEEVEFSRGEYTALVQLRLGLSGDLNSFRSRIGHFSVSLLQTRGTHNTAYFPVP